MCARSIYPYHVIAAVDGSEHSRAALSVLQELPLPAGSRITVLAVLLPRNASDYAALEAVLAKAVTILQKPDLQIESELLSGSPGEMLSQYAEAYPPDLMVMGAKGLRSALEVLLGGVAQQMIEYAHWPVLIVRAPYIPIKKVLLAVDGSAYSRCAADFLLQMPLPPGCSQSIIHVLPPSERPQMSYQYFPHGTEMYLPPVALSQEIEEKQKAFLEEEEKQGRKLLEEYMTLFAQAGHSTECYLQRGDAAAEIIAFTKLNQIDLVVSGSRGLGTMKGLFLGSVSRKLAHYSKCSILIVKGGRYGEN